MNLPQLPGFLRATVLGLATALLAGAPALAEPGVTNDTIVLGQSTALSGPLGDLGQEVLKGSKAYFDALNARGGINGRKIVLNSKDDAYDTKKTLENVEAFIAGGDTFALFGTFGTPNNEALIPVALKAGMPVLMPYTGAPSIRKPEMVGVFNLRASYADEADKLIQHLTTIGFKRIGIAYQNNNFGKEVLLAATAALEQRKLKPVAAVSVENSASDAASATTTLLGAQPDALVLGLAGKPTIEVIKSVNQSRKGLQMYALSVLATAGNLKTLGADGTGVAISQVVPFPTNSTMLYGHLETLDERLRHMIMLREAQDETGGFLTFIPLAFQPGDTGIKPRDRYTSAIDDLRTIAVPARLAQHSGYAQPRCRGV